MKSKAVALLLFITAALVGCDKWNEDYELVRAGDSTYLLNTKSGETRLLAGNTLVPIKAADLKDPTLGTAKTWPGYTPTEGLKLAVRTKYRDGQMLYVVEASPFSGRLAKEFSSSANAAIVLDLYDSDGFVAAEPIRLRLREGTQLVDSKGVTQSLSWSGAQAAPTESYGAVETISVRWVGFGEEPLSAADIAAVAADAADAANNPE